MSQEAARIASETHVDFLKPVGELTLTEILNSRNYSTGTVEQQCEYLKNWIVALESKMAGEHLTPIESERAKKILNFLRVLAEEKRGNLRK